MLCVTLNSDNFLQNLGSISPQTLFSEKPQLKIINFQENPPFLERVLLEIRHASLKNTGFWENQYLSLFIKNIIMKYEKKNVLLESMELKLSGGLFIETYD